MRGQSQEKGLREEVQTAGGKKKKCSLRQVRSIKKNDSINEKGVLPARGTRRGKSQEPEGLWKRWGRHDQGFRLPEMKGDVF